MKDSRAISLLVAIGIFLNACSVNVDKNDAGATPKDSIKETFSLKGLVEEKKYPADSTMVLLHAQHHSYKVLGGGTLAGPFNAPDMKHSSDHALPVEYLPFIFATSCLLFTIWVTIDPDLLALSLYFPLYASLVLMS